MPPANRLHWQELWRLLLSVALCETQLCRARTSPDHHPAEALQPSPSGPDWVQVRKQELDCWIQPLRLTPSDSAKGLQDTGFLSSNKDLLGNVSTLAFRSIHSHVPTGATDQPAQKKRQNNNRCSQGTGSVLAPACSKIAFGRHQEEVASRCFGIDRMPGWIGSRGALARIRTIEIRQFSTKRVRFHI